MDIGAEKLDVFANVDEDSVDIPEIKELIINIKYFTTIVQLLIKIKNDSLDLNIIRKSIDIFSELENEAGLEIVYDKLVAFLTKNKNYEEAIIFNKLLINCNHNLILAYNTLMSSRIWKAENRLFSSNIKQSYAIVKYFNRYFISKCKKNIEKIFKSTQFSIQMKLTI